MTHKKLKFMKYIFISTFLVPVILLSGFVYAQSIEYSYDDATETLTINIAGAMEDYNENYLPPWQKYADTCKQIILSDDLTSVGSYSFSNFDNVETIEVPDNVTRIGFGAFSQCKSLNILYLPKSVLSIDDASFAYYADNLKSDFILVSEPGSYALHYARQNGIAFDMSSSVCGVTQVNIDVKGMKAYYKYTAKVNGEFRIYSSGAQDTFGAVYDKNFNILASNDDITDSNTNFSINMQLAKGEVYYISANLLSSGITGRFNLRIIPVNYEVNFTLNAMENKTGKKSDILVRNALVNNVSCDGTYSETSSKLQNIYTISWGSEEKTITITPDSDDYIVIDVSDINHDGYVNAKDFAVMKKSYPEYIGIFENFISTN